MIGVSIVALSLLVNLSSAPAPTTVPVASLPSLKLPSLKLPHISLPKLRMPHLPKRDGSGDPLAQTSRRLTALVGDQEKWYSDHAAYSTNASKLSSNRLRADTALDKVQVQVLYASTKGWTAMASHPDAPGKSCVIYVGYRNALPIVPRTRADAADAVQEAKPICDR
jgi:hypothetical protein